MKTNKTLIEDSGSNPHANLAEELASKLKGKGWIYGGYTSDQTMEKEIRRDYLAKGKSEITFIKLASGGLDYWYKENKNSLDLETVRKFKKEYVITIEGDVIGNDIIIACSHKKAEQDLLQSLHATNFLADEVERFWQIGLANRKVTIVSVSKTLDGKAWKT